MSQHSLETWHTSGRVVVIRKADYHPQLNGPPLIDSRRPYHNEVVMECRTPEEAERVAACVNACRGIPTEVLLHSKIVATCSDSTCGDPLTGNEIVPGLCDSCSSGLAAETGG